MNSAGSGPGEIPHGWVNHEIGVQALLSERGKTHGEFADHASITQALKRVMWNHPGYPVDDMQREALEMIVHKIGRIIAGNSTHVDHWADIAGYAQLIADRLPKVT